MVDPDAVTLEFDVVCCCTKASRKRCAAIACIYPSSGGLDGGRRDLLELLDDL